MKPFNLKWTKGNTKLKKLKTLGFGIPAFASQDGFKTCPMAGKCATVCYARQGTFTWPIVKAAREFNLSVARQSNFATLAIDDLKRLKAFKVVRIHDSGDFFSQDYLTAWFTIAMAYPEKIFYAYTKSLHLDFSGKPNNFKIIQSEGGKMDKLINKAQSHSRIFADETARIAAGYVDGNIDDSPAIEGEIKIGLVYHGVRNMTDEQKKIFS
jgi:hypothetical protein